MLKTKLEVGDTYREDFCVTQQQVEQFAALSGDKNPIHLDPVFAAATKFKQTIMHGSLATAFFSKILGMDFPGDGTVFIEQHYRFLAPMFPAQEYVAELSIKEVLREKSRAVVQTTIKHKDSGDVCIDGTVLVSNKIRL